MPERYDLIIRGGTVFDGSGAPGRAADVGVRGDRIVIIGDFQGSAPVEIEAAGKAVTPGFIDVHSHDDLTVLRDPEFACKVMQGVTTDIVGNCGTGPAPFSTAMAAWRIRAPELDGLDPWEGHTGYLARIDGVAPSLNIAALIGHGTLRTAVMGSDTKRPATADEVQRMRLLVEEGVAAGCVGFSSGLIYEPGRYSDTAELIALASAVGPDGGLYATHMRNEGAYLVDAVREAIRVGEEAGVPVEISHHKASGRDAWGRVRDSIKLIEAARERGLDVTADQYPYTAGSTSLYAVVVLNNALNEQGNEGGIGRVDPENILIASAPERPEYEGLTLRELADRFDLPAEEAAMRILSESPGTATVIETMDEADVRTVLAHPTTMIGSDGLALGSKPHPRLYGTFPRVLGRYCRDQGVIDLPTAVHKMTGKPAAKFRLPDRGVLREGAFADIVVFDPATIADTGTYQEPTTYPRGIDAVIVNGTVVARDGVHTGARPGRAVRRG